MHPLFTLPGLVLCIILSAGATEHGLPAAHPPAPHQPAATQPHQGPAAATPVTVETPSATPSQAADPHDAAKDAAEKPAQGLSGRQALDRLLAGNKRFLADVTSRAHHGTTRRDAVAAKQHPVAVVVCCSDSRVPPELLFDQGLGDLFVVRTAGNVIDALALGSIEYACDHLHVPLVIVLGHERCGAVTAAVSGGTPSGHVLSVVEQVQRNIGQDRPAAGDVVEQAIQCNARTVAQQITTSTPILAGLVTSEHLVVVAARYDLDSGEVTLLP